MSEAQLDFLLQKVSPLIQKADTFWRSVLHAKLKLQITLHNHHLFCDSSQTCCAKDTHDFDISLKMFPCDRLSKQKTFSNFASTTDYAAK